MAIVVFAFSAWRLARAVAASANSDSLYLAGMYRDLFLDHIPIDGWHTQPAPSFFPDLPVFFLLRAITGQAVLALGAYAVVSLLVGVWFIVATARLLEIEGRSRVWMAAFLGMGALAYVDSFGDFFHLCFAPSCHGSCVWVSLGCALLIARQIKAKRFRVVPAVFIMVMTALTRASDNEYVLYAAGLGVALVFTMLVVKSGRLVLLGNLVAIAVADHFYEQPAKIYEWLGMTVEPYPPSIEFSWKRVTHTLELLPPPEEQLSVLFLNTAAFVIASAVLFVVCGIIVARFHPQRRQNTDLLGFFASVVLGIFCCVFFGMAFSGGYWNVWCGRYLQAWIVMPFLVLPIVWLLTERWAFRGALLVVFGAVMCTQGAPDTSEKMKPLLADSVTYPAANACIDEIALRYGVRFGYGDYWYARRTTELSRAGLRVLSVARGVTPNAWIANPATFAAAATAPSFLVITTNLDDSAVRSRLGSPAHIESCQGCPVTGYSSSGGCENEYVWVYSGAPRLRLVP